MDERPPFSDLESYALQCLDAARYPGDHHRFRLYRCPSCGVVAFELTIEPHSGSRPGNFRGVIWGRCARCGRQERLFSFTGEHREPRGEKAVVCPCGGTRFHVGEGERFEGDEGLPGFFDEGVVVGCCAACGRKRILIRTD